MNENDIVRTGLRRSAFVDFVSPPQFPRLSPSQIVPDFYRFFDSRRSISSFSSLALPTVLNPFIV